ncbi:MAG: hypothetical protein R6W99_06670 [Clostridia bacterium]
MKGIVIEKGSGKSIVMDRSGRFIKTRTMKGWREGDEVNFTSDSARTAGALSFAAAFVITAALGLYGAFALNSYTVNLDVNPSISIEANAFNVVREITAMNDDAEQIGDLSELMGMKVGQAVNEAILILLEEGYLQADGTVVLSIEGSNSKVRTVVREVSDAIENAFVESQDGSETGDPDTEGIKVYVGRITEEMAVAAEELGIPYGRVVLAAKAVEEGADMDYEMASLLSIQEIQRIRNISKTIDKATDVLEGTSKSNKEDGKARIKQVEAMSDKILDEAIKLEKNLADLSALIAGGNAKEETIFRHAILEAQLEDILNHIGQLGFTAELETEEIINGMSMSGGADKEEKERIREEIEIAREASHEAKKEEVRTRVEEKMEEVKDKVEILKTAKGKSDESQAAKQNNPGENAENNAGENAGNSKNSGDDAGDETGGNAGENGNSSSGGSKN